MALFLALVTVSALPVDAAPTRDRVVVTFADHAARASALSDTGLRTRADDVANASSLGRRVAILDLTPAQRAALADEPGVVAIESDVAMHADLIPTDPFWSYQSGARAIDADDAWDTTTANPTW